MMQRFKVFSADWEIVVSAQDFVDAVLLGTSQKYDSLGLDFHVGKVIGVLNCRTQEIEIYSPVAVLEDLHKYEIAKNLYDFLKIWEKL